MAILIVLLILLVLSSAVYALGRAFGYNPGIGVVEQSSSMRMLEAPAPLEREGIRLTVTNVIASSASTSIRFQVEWLNSSTMGKFDTGCQGMPALILSDGRQLNFVRTADKFTVGEPGSNVGYGYMMEFEPIPADQNNVTFLYPCINPLHPGPLPRDWQISMHLIPAPEGFALPVVTVPTASSTEIPPSEATSPSISTSVVDPAHQINTSVDSFISTEDGYLLIGSMQWSASDYPAYGVKPIAFTGYINVIDANGQEIAWEEVYGNVKPQNEEYRSYWAIKVLSKTFAPPLKITMNAVDVQIQPITFQFEAGASPQAGQSWELSQEFQVVDSLVHLVKANLISSEGKLNFLLDIQVDDNTIGDVYITTPLSQCMGGGGAYPTEHLSTLQVFVPMCRPDLPPGKVEMQVTGAVLWGEWQVSWQP